MSGIIDQSIQKSLHMTLGWVQELSSALATGSAATRSRGFRQWEDFNQAGQVQHLHLQHLEWLYGSVYRKHTRHVLLLYNFDVAQSELKGAHRSALEAFTLAVLFPHYLNVLRGRQGFARYFETYEQPFAVNVSLAQKRSLLLSQPWVGDVGRDDALKYAETERFHSGGALRAPFQRFDTFFPVLDPTLTVEQLQALSPAESRKFVQGRISGSFARQYRPFLIDKLLNLGPAQGSQPYPFTSITGHASATGPEAQNSILSQQRAATVLTYLHSLLSDQCADVANVNPQLAGNVEALGSQSPIWGVDTEVEENRSVKLVFETAYDYLHLEDEAALHAAYAGRVEIIRGQLENYVEHGKAWQQALATGAAFQPDHGRKAALDRLMREADHNLALGMSTLSFARHYQGDFATLPADGTLADIPPRANSMAFFQYATPEGYTTERMLPIPFILQHGKYSEHDGHKFNLPVSAADKLAAAVPILTRYIQEYASQLFANVADVVGVRQRLDAMGRIIQQDYSQFYATNPIRAHSFLLAPFARRQDFEAALDNQDTLLQVEYKGRNVAVPILHYRFITTALKERGGPPYYWYDQKVLNAQVAAKTQLAPLVLEADRLYKDLVRDTLHAAGMHMSSSDDLYYLLEIYFWVWNAA